VGDFFGAVNGTNTLIISRAGSDTINGATTNTIAQQYGWKRLVSNGVNSWSVDAAIASSLLTFGIPGLIEVPENKSYKVNVSMPFAGTITETTTQSVLGTCTATFKINAVNLGGTPNAVSSSKQTQAHASNNTFVAGDDITITVSANASCEDMSFMIKATRLIS